jgi:RimJ/RimL family protein N-acetyltransferase
MFGGRIQCEESGAHRVTTDRLELISGRLSDEAQYEALCTEPEIEHWLGQGAPATPITRAARQAHAQPLWQPQAIRPASLRYTLFVAVHRATSMVIGGVGLGQHGDGSHHVGGAIRGGFRNQGYGLEVMVAVLDVLHRHFGLLELRAGCAADNVASRRWLTAAGFEPAAGPATFSLRDGRVIDSIWWSHRAPDAKQRCERLYSAPAQPESDGAPPESPAPSSAGTLR